MSNKTITELQSEIESRIQEVCEKVNTNVAERMGAQHPCSNSVILTGFYGGDTTHALSAWTSTSRDLNDEKRRRIAGLLNTLVHNDSGKVHGTPFEKSQIHFLVTSEIASHIHMLKHRVAVQINGESARYKELKDDKCFLPNDWPVEEREALNEHFAICAKKYHEALARLTPLLGRKRAKESARFYLPYNTQISVDISFNFRSFQHFLELRKSSSAQAEIREIAEWMYACVEELGTFQHTLTAFKK